MSCGERKVKAWEEVVKIPTYAIGKPDKNPMFLEKRVYQGSSGRVYPIPVIDKIYDEKEDKEYNVVFLENKYLKIMIMPELGGRIQRALDKTNNYDFVYYNHVIKPALVGLAGPWISGGIEFNWPQHHRPNTFGPVDYTIEENEDGSTTLWVSEIDRMYGTKGTAGFTLYPDKAYLEIKGQLYNRTAENQTFLWWANPAVAVNDYTQSVFPPDVHAVFDHGKRDVSKFPIATGVYYKMDYSAGVDISRYKNIPVPTSYMAYHSDYNFVGGYDHNVQAGILHVANHHISPGKKQWTWGNGDFGKAWDRNLTDEDGPYIELMTGMFTDNQPDFTWLKPYEEKTFKQYFMPYKNIGVVSNANINAAVSMVKEGNLVKISAYATALYDNVTVLMKGQHGEYLNEKISISPESTYYKEIVVGEEEQDHYIKVALIKEDGAELVSYTPKKKSIEKTPEPAKAIGAPKDLKNNEALYLAGIHLEQYRHATYEADAYYLEGLVRDPEDIRINNAYGALLFRRGNFAQAEKYLRQAVSTSMKHSPNPYDGEPLYNLGLALLHQGKLNEAYDRFYKATWNAAWQDSGFFSVAQIDCLRGDFELALEHSTKSMVRNYHSIKCRNLKSAVLRTLGKIEDAKRLTLETVEIDKLDHGAKNELYLIAVAEGKEAEASSIKAELTRIMRGDVHSYIALAQEYGNAGFYKEAIEVINRYIQGTIDVYPMAYYYKAYYLEKAGVFKEADICYELGDSANSDYCFPNSLQDMLVLEAAIKRENSGSKAYYYLGNLLYDKKQYERVIESWEKSVAIDDTFPTVFRNLSLAYYNKANNVEKAKACLERAFELNTKDARVLLELDQLYKKLGVSLEKRFEFLEDHLDVVEQRDDLYIEYITLLNTKKQHEKALKLIEQRQFHPWEGGEGKVTKQYVYANVELAKALIKEGKNSDAIKYLNSAVIYPDNLGEGKLSGAQDNDINYYLGCAYEALGEIEKAGEFFENASKGLDVPASAMFYNDQPPETIFYQGLALLKLNKKAEAKGRFNKLIDYGEQHLFDDVKIDYFAVSLPDFLIFEEDLNKKNRIHCYYLIGLGNIGLKNFSKAKENMFKALELDVNNQGVLIHLDFISQQ
jgi:tetratricopeptide (TPR) repeat protein